MGMWPKTMRGLDNPRRFKEFARLLLAMADDPKMSQERVPRHLEACVRHFESFMRQKRRRADRAASCKGVGAQERRDRRRRWAKMPAWQKILVGTIAQTGAALLRMGMLSGRIQEP